MKQIKTFLKTYLLSGIIILLPIVITIWVFRFLILTMDQIVDPLIRATLPQNIQDLIPQEVHGYGIIVTFFIVLLVGIIGKNYLGQFFIKKVEKIVGKLPLIPKVYSSIKQIPGIFMGNDSNAYNGVALIEYPRKGLYTLALITGKPDRIFSTTIGSENLVSLYVPTTPNPTSGFYLVAREDEIRKLNISVESALKLILSCGIIQVDKK